MPAVRLSRRRRSSLALSTFNPAKAGYYGIQLHSPRPVTFAPNVTPGTFVEPDLICSEDSSPAPGSPTSKLFPPSELPAPAPSRRRVPPGKRRSLGYIPRPPNAFMLFRADFVRQKHVPGSIETNHGSLSKIIGNCWRSLPLEEKRVWEVKAKHAKAEHKARYPEYRFRPVHNKNKDKKKEKPTVTAEDERRCEEVAQLLLEGKKGDELAAAVRDLDHLRSNSPAPRQLYPPRRPSSVPLPDYSGIALPSIPFLPFRDDTGRYGSMSRASRMWLGQRRASSAQPFGGLRPMWGAAPMLPPTVLQRDESPLPEVDMSLFEQSFLDASPFQSQHPEPPYNFNGFMSSLPPNATSHQHDPTHNISPLDNINLQNPSIPVNNVTVNDNSYVPDASVDQMTWYNTMDHHSGGTHSDPSSAYSGSPTPSDELTLPVHAPQPQHAHATVSESYDMWKGINPAFHGAIVPEHHQQQQIHQHQEMQMHSFEQHHHQHHHHHSLDYNTPTSCGNVGDVNNVAVAVGGVDHMQNYATDLQGLFVDASGSQYSMNGGSNLDTTGQIPTTHPMMHGFDLNELVHEY